MLDSHPHQTCHTKQDNADGGGRSCSHPDCPYSSHMLQFHQDAQYSGDDEGSFNDLAKCDKK